jgi:hypothetical protein
MCNLRRPIAALLLVWYLPACRYIDPQLVVDPEEWQQAEGASPREVIEEQRPRVVRITLADGQQRVISGPVVVNDTLAGLETRGTAKSFAVPIDQVVAVEIPSGFAKTSRAVLPFVFIAGIVALVVLVAGGFFDNWFEQ